jgi:hypothetical protein
MTILHLNQHSKRTLFELHAHTLILIYRLWLSRERGQNNNNAAPKFGNSECDV